MQCRQLPLCFYEHFLRLIFVKEKKEAEVSFIYSFVYSLLFSLHDIAINTSGGSYMLYYNKEFVYIYPFYGEYLYIIHIHLA